MQEQVDVGNMFDDLERQHDVELRAGCSERLGGLPAIIDRELLAGGMPERDGDVALGGVDAGHRGAEPRHRLAEQAAAAADIEHRQALEGTGKSIAPPMLGGTIADVGEPHRVQPMQRRELAGRIPPLLRDARKALDLRRIDRRA